MSQDQIDLAILGLNNSVNRIIRRYERKNDTQLPSSEIQQINDILLHMKHCLRQLQTKLFSLEQGLDVFLNFFWPECVREYSKKKSLDDWKPALEALFQHILRLHDGLIFLISGECRHKYDISNAKKNTKYASKIATQALRSDGYTKLYAGKYYSGTGWDEFMTSEACLQQRLLKILEPLVSPSKRLHLWDDLIEHGAHALEAVLTDVETKLNQVQDTFRNQLRTTVTQTLQRTLGKYSSNVSISLSLQDKMESLQVHALGKQKTTLARRASRFQILDKQGVLPTNGTVQYWQQIMVVPHPRDTPAPTDDQDDHIKDNKPSKSAPLARGIQVTTMITNASSNSTSPQKESIRDIKQSMGVDAEALAQAHDTLQAEQAGTLMAAALMDQIAESSDGDDRLWIKQAKLEVKRCRRLLQESVAPLDVWDFREGYRQALMEAGNLCLWTMSSCDDVMQRDKNLVDACKYFENACRCVDLQQSLMEKMVYENELNVTENAGVLRRHVKIVSSQARANQGIAIVELCKHRDKNRLKPTIDVYTSLNAFDDSIRDSKDLEKLVCEDNDVESALDKVQSAQLQALATRWKSVALWMIGKHDKASICVSETKKLAEKVQHVLSAENTDDLLEPSVEVFTECYYAWTVLADLATLNLERLSGSADSALIGDKLILLVDECCSEAGALSLLLQNLYARRKRRGECEHLFMESGILIPSELRNSAKSLERWWIERKTFMSSPVGLNDRNVTKGIERGDIRTDGFLLKENYAPRGVFVVVEGASRRRKKRQTSMQSSTKSGNRNRECSNQTPLPPLSRYIKWGDGFLPQEYDEKSGKIRPKVPYPAVAPPMPSDIAAKVREASYSVN